MIVSLADNILKNKLSEQDYSYIDSAPIKEIPKTIIFYIYGGVCYEEVRQIYELNKKYSDYNFKIIGTSELNTRSFFDNYILY